MLVVSRYDAAESWWGETEREREHGFNPQAVVE